jgi:hypothetical protein
MKAARLALLSLCFTGPVCAAALDLDPTFGAPWSPGRAQAAFDLAGDDADMIEDLAIAPGTQAIYAVGGVEIGSQRNAAVLLKRKPDGSTDTEFAVGTYSSGVMRFDSLWSLGLSRFYAVALDGNGAVFAAGARHLADGRSCAFVVKVLDTPVHKGKLDGSFASSGTYTRCAAGNGWGAFSDVKLLADGRVLLAWNEGDTSALLRLTPNGVPDATFGLGGAHAIDVRPGKTEYAQRIAVSPIGYYVAGHARYDDGLDWDAYVLRVRTVGTRDTAFAGGVRIEAPDLLPENRRDLLADLALDASGRPLLLVNSSNQHVFVIRHTTLGQRDVGFGNNGRAAGAIGVADTTAEGTSWPRGAALAIDTAQRIWVAGSRLLPTPDASLLAAGRFDSSGNPIGEYALFDYAEEEYGATLTLDAQQRPLLGTRVRTSLQQYDFDYGFVRLRGGE